MANKQFTTRDFKSAIKLLERIKSQPRWYIYGEIEVKFWNGRVKDALIIFGICEYQTICSTNYINRPLLIKNVYLRAQM